MMENGTRDSYEAVSKTDVGDEIIALDPKVDVVVASSRLKVLRLDDHEDPRNWAANVIPCFPSYFTHDVR